jgi:periplasmic divalent cation tolerance protein
MLSLILLNKPLPPQSFHGTQAPGFYQLRDAFTTQEVLMSIFICLVACPDQEVGSALAKLLVDRELAACVQVLPPMRSVYRWKGEVCIDEEALLLIKTAGHLTDEVRKTIEENHPYEVPEFVTLQASDVSEKYTSWLLANVRG